MTKSYLIVINVLFVGIFTTGCSSNNLKQAHNKNAANHKLQLQDKAPQKQVSVKSASITLAKAKPTKKTAIRKVSFQKNTPNINNSFAKSLSNAAMERLRHKVRYDGKYIKIAYPWGDVPANIGVCTDVVIRSYRRLGIDLQQKVHEDMSQGGFFDYPNLAKWKLTKPDRNIDHRRVYNLQAFFRRHGASLPVSRNPNNYKPGDLVTWMVNPEFPHIGVVVEERSKTDPRRHMIVHNIGRGTEMEDILFAFPVTGHYRYTNSNKLVAPRRFNTYYASTKGETLSEDMIRAINALNL